MAMDTTIFGHMQAGCWDQDEFEAMVRENEGLFQDWAAYIQDRLGHGPDGRLTVPKLADGCGVSINCAGQFRHKIPAKRSNVIKIAAMLRMNVEQTNDMLTRWAKYSRLYAKHPHDAIWIHILRNGGSDQPDKLFKAYKKIYTQLQKEYRNSNVQEQAAGQNTAVMLQELISAVQPELRKAKEDTVFWAMIRKHLPAYETAHQKLIEYIEGQFVRLQDGQAGRLTLAEKDELRENLVVTPRVLFRDNKTYLTLYYNRMRKLKKNHEVPERCFLISLGIRLAMNIDQINYMLELAGMAPLCYKDRLECAIAFYLEELYMQVPSFFRSNPLAGDSEADRLRDYCFGEMNTQTDDTPLLKFDTQHFAPSENMKSYIRRRLEETNIFPADEDTALEAFLELL